MQLQKIYFDEFWEEQGENCIDDITWNDLEMDKVFSHINYTKSYAGEQVLYKRLRELEVDREWIAFEEKICFLEIHEKARRKIEKWLNSIGKKSEKYYLPGFLHDTDLWIIKNGFVFHILQGLLCLCIIMLLSMKDSIFLTSLLIMACVNLVVYLRTKHKYEVYLHSLGSVLQLINFCKRVLADKEIQTVFGEKKVEDALKSLKRVSKGIGKVALRKNISRSGDPMALFYDYILGITLYDISVFNHIMKTLDKKQSEVVLLYQFAGEIDMINAVATFREKQAQVCQPGFTEEWKMEACGLYHPLLKDAVCNDFSMNGRMILSGPNASGKSTFMKAVAINVILAQTIHTCTADEMKLPGIYVMTSMSLRDDILSGESYYIREVKYLKRMLDKADAGIPVLCVIDEILRGTNTGERLAASEAILKYFTEKMCFVLVASHDLELLNKMQKDYACYYFDSWIGEKDIYFDYKLHKGMGGKSNAIALLTLLGYPEHIVKTARELMKEHYENR